MINSIKIDRNLLKFVVDNRMRVEEIILRREFVIINVFNLIDYKVNIIIIKIHFQLTAFKI